MNTSPKTRRIAAVALAVAVLPFTAGQANAAVKTRPHVKRTPAVATTTAAPSTAAATTTTTAAAPVTSVISIGGYVFYNMTYLEAVDAWAAAVAAAPAGYVPPVVTSVSVSTTVSGTVENGNG
jgi:hypothetical protein